MSYHVAVIGATGNVGHEMLQILAERDFPVESVHAVASRDSLGKEISFGESRILKVEDIEQFSFDGIDLALFAVDNAIAERYVPKAEAAGAFVIDNSSAFRMDVDVPLIIPEVNGDAIFMAKTRGLVANPNCAMIQMVTALKPLHDAAQITRIVVSTYQSVSGAGKLAMDELYEQTKGVYTFQEPEPKAFHQKIAFNVIPHIGLINEAGVSGEEEKLVAETQKLLGADVAVFASCVRVPVFVGHAMNVNIEMKRSLSPEEASDLLKVAPSIEVFEGDEDGMRALTPDDVVGQDEVFVSRVRKDPTVEHGLAMWVVSDNLRKGAALNAVQIAELAVHQQLI